MELLGVYFMVKFGEISDFGGIRVFSGGVSNYSGEMRMFWVGTDKVSQKNPRKT